MPKQIITSGRAILGVALVAMTAPAMASANLQVRFIEGAPKDRFQIENTSDSCAIGQATITLDLSTSPAGLIFDVTDQGAGVEVFQPLELVAGVSALSKMPAVTDGQSSVVLDVARLAPGAAIAFTIDVDDTLGTRAITVSGSEIAGATVALAPKTDPMQTPVLATFSQQARAEISLEGCSS